MDGRHIDPRVLGCLLLNVSNDWGSLGDIVGPANLENGGRTPNAAICINSYLTSTLIFLPPIMTPFICSSAS